MNTFQDENNGWLQQNARSLGISAAILLGVSAVMWYLPRAKAAAQQESWQRFDNYTVQLNQVDTDDDLNAAWLSVQSDPKIDDFAWMTTVAWAASLQKDSATLATIQGMSSGLSGSTSGLKVIHGGQPTPLVDAVKERLQGLSELKDLEAEAIEPTGSKIRMTITDGAEETYELVFQLYENEAPNGCAWLFAQMDAGAFETVNVIPGPGSGLQIEEIGEVDEDADPLLVEKAWGCFHLSGTLCTMLENGGDPGQQSRTKLQLMGTDLTQQDGVTSVLGKIVEGEDLLTTINELPKSEDNPRAFAKEWRLTVERVDG